MMTINLNALTPDALAKLYMALVEIAAKADSPVDVMELHRAAHAVQYAGYANCGDDAFDALTDDLIAS